MGCELNESDFAKISQFVYSLCGINLHDGKKELVKARLGKRIREGNFQSFADYYKFVRTEKGAEELITMIDALSTNLTSFFREEKHFGKVREIIMEKLYLLSRNGGRALKLRIWSAGCSTGEEPYTLAMIVKEAIGNKPADVKIFATDISTRVLKTAMAGVYSQGRIQRIPGSFLRKYFQVGQGKWDGYYRVKKELRDMVQFQRFNLMEPPSFGELFDIMFCRNVMIYFDKKTQEALIGRFCNVLKDDGYLFVGHSESLAGLKHDFNYIEPSVYRK